MTSPSLEQVNAALATVHDPEIRRPITEIGMVDSVEIGDDGFETVLAMVERACDAIVDELRRVVDG